MTTRIPLAFLAVTALALTGCFHRGGARISPERAASIARARAALTRAAEARDLDGFVTHVAPGAKLTLGRDTLDLRSVAAGIAAGLPRDASARHWLAGARLRACDRWEIESGGEFGYSVEREGARPDRRRYLYAIAWGTDAEGEAVVQSAALVAGDFGAPSIAGCRPSPKELFDARRFGVAVLPGVGAAFSLAPAAVDRAMRDRGADPRRSGGVPGFGRSLPLTLPALGSAWWRASRGWSFEALATLSTTSYATSAFDPAAALATGIRLQQRWFALLASARVRDLQLGAGPAFVREAWRVSVERLIVDTALTVGAHLTDAGSTRDRIGLLAQGRLTAPLSRWLNVEVRGHLLLLPSGATPPAYGTPAIRVNTSSLGASVLVGVGY